MRSRVLAALAVFVIAISPVGAQVSANKSVSYPTAISSVRSPMKHSHAKPTDVTGYDAQVTVGLDVLAEHSITDERMLKPNKLRIKQTPIAVRSNPSPSHLKGRVRGTATWYCLPGVSACHHAHSGGLYAAAGSELRTGKWRGSKVRVCAGDRCVIVTLIDWCACKGERVIDLYSDAFRKLAPLSRGVLRVTVTRA